MRVASENAGPVALLEATAEVRTFIEELTRLAEELKVREERLGELLAPSEAALRARTEYLDRMARDQLARAGERVAALAEEVARIAVRTTQDVTQAVARLDATDARRRNETRRRDRLRTILGLLAMLVGGFLAGQVASWRSGATTSLRSVAIEAGTSVAKTAPLAPKRSARRTSKPPGTLAP